MQEYLNKKKESIVYRNKVSIDYPEIIKKFYRWIENGTHSINLPIEEINHKYKKYRQV